MGRRDYEGEYVKAPPDPTIWLVQDGRRIKLHSKEDWWHYGLRPLHKISAEEVAAIPLAGEEIEDDEGDDEDTAGVSGRVIQYV